MGIGVCWPLGSFGSSNSDTAPSEEWPQSARTNRGRGGWKVHNSVGVPARRKAADQRGSGPAAIHECCVCFAERPNRGCKTGLTVDGENPCLLTQDKLSRNIEEQKIPPAFFFFFACTLNGRLQVNLHGGVGGVTLPWPLR